MYSCSMGESSGSSNQTTLATEVEPNVASYLPPISCDPIQSSIEQASLVTSIEETIAKSKSHWSQVGNFDCNNEVAEVSNKELFKTLQAHPTWGGFFLSFGKGEGSCGELLMGEKFAEGAQAEIYDVQVKWYDPKICEYDQKHSHEYVLKVFKKGTFLCHLQSQWPQGMLQFHADQVTRCKLGLPLGIRLRCDVMCGTLLEDGRFAFLMVKQQEDLRTMINRRMLTRSNDEGPFSKQEALKAIYEIAFGMNQLHKRGIVHRDIKASNVLVSRFGVCFIADFECSVGVVGTGFFRAPEILEACKQRNVNSKVGLFTKAVDIYSYGMTCYEILTGKLPFEGHPGYDYDLVLQGQRPEVPDYVDGWIRQLLDSCWQSNPDARPTSQEIVKTLQTNSKTCRYWDLTIQTAEVMIGIREVWDSKTSKIIRMRRSLPLMLKLAKVKMLWSCRK